MSTGSRRKKQSTAVIEVLGASNWCPSSNGEGSFLIAARGSRGVEIELLGHVHRYHDSRLRFDVPGLSRPEFQKLAGPLTAAVAAMLQEAGCIEEVRSIVPAQLALFESAGGAF
jgi:hypothetical protein